MDDRKLDIVAERLKAVRTTRNAFLRAKTNLNEHIHDTIGGFLQAFPPMMAEDQVRKGLNYLGLPADTILQYNGSRVFKWESGYVLDPASRARLSYNLTRYLEANSV